MSYLEYAEYVQCNMKGVNDLQSFIVNANGQIAVVDELVPCQGRIVRLNNGLGNLQSL
jgi:hypothetical protein